MKRQDEVDDEVRIVPDGGIVRVPLFAMDAKQRAVATAAPVATPPTPLHRPGFAPLSAEETNKRMGLYRGAERRLSERWRATIPPAQQPAPDAKPTLAEVYARRDKQLCERWKGAR
jgi:hypothetical protein